MAENGWVERDVTRGGKTYKQWFRVGGKKGVPPKGPVAPPTAAAAAPAAKKAGPIQRLAKAKGIEGKKAVKPEVANAADAKEALKAIGSKAKPGKQAKGGTAIAVDNGKPIKGTDTAAIAKADEHFNGQVAAARKLGWTETNRGAMHTPDSPFSEYNFTKTEGSRNVQMTMIRQHNRRDNTVEHKISVHAWETKAGPAVMPLMPD
jgi:hypothetical protein